MPGLLQLHPAAGQHEGQGQDQSHDAPDRLEEEGGGHLQGGALPLQWTVVLEQGRSVLLQRFNERNGRKP